MPARVVVVLDEADGLAQRTVETLLAEGIDTLALPSSMVALDALEASQRIELLVTCPEFVAGPPNGIALARMARLKRSGSKSCSSARWSSRISRTGWAISCRRPPPWMT
jgi:hypothetical protein